MYIFNVLSKKNKHISVKYDLLLIIFKKVMSAYVLYKIDFFFKTIFWVVQIFLFFRFKLVDYFHKQFACEKQKDRLLSYSQYYRN